MKAGNGNRTKSKRKPDPYGREKFITYEMKLQISHSISTEISEKSTLMIFKRHANIKYKYGRRVFWSKEYYVNTVGGNEAAIKRYILTKNWMTK